MRRILFLGGGGLLSSAVAAELANAGDELTIVTRGPLKRSAPLGTRHLRGDVTDVAVLRSLVDGADWDAVVNWVAYQPADFAAHPAILAGHVGQYVLISTCSVFARPIPLLPITESTARRQPVFGYARGKLECELAAQRIFQDTGFPIAVVRPFHTYDHTAVPLLTGWTAIDQMRRGRPVVVHGDGTSLWSLTHSSDFASAFTPLLADARLTGESVNVVNDTPLTWDQIHLELGRAAGAPPVRLVHVSSQELGARVEWLGEVLEHDFRHSMVFDTTKLRRLVPGWAPRVPFSEGAREVVAHGLTDPAMRTIDPQLAAIMEEFAARDMTRMRNE